MTGVRLPSPPPILLTMEDFESISEFLKTDKGKKFINKYHKLQDIQINRYLQFEKYVETIDFDKLIYRLVMEHGEEYCEKCNHNGFEPYPNNKLNFLFSYLENNKKPLKEIPSKLNCDFPNEVWEYKGYYFQIIWGQGAIFLIFNKKDLQLVLRV